MEIKDIEIYKQIEKILAETKQKDKEIYGVAMQLLSEVYTEFNSGKIQNIENKVYTLINNIANNNLKK